MQILKGRSGFSTGDISAAIEALKPRRSFTRLQPRLLQHRRYLAVILLWCVGAAWVGSYEVASAATPQSVPKSCGTPGLPSCPSPPPIISPWLYYGLQPFAHSAPFNS